MAVLVCPLLAMVVHLDLVGVEYGCDGEGAVVFRGEFISDRQDCYHNLLSDGVRVSVGGVGVMLSV